MQFVRFQGTGLADPVVDQKTLGGTLMTQLRLLDELLTLQVRLARTSDTALTHENVPDYPIVAVRELTMSCCSDCW